MLDEFYTENETTYHRIKIVFVNTVHLHHWYDDLIPKDLKKLANIEKGKNIFNQQATNIKYQYIYHAPKPILDTGKRNLSFASFCAFSKSLENSMMINSDRLLVKVFFFFVTMLKILVGLLLHNITYYWCWLQHKNKNSVIKNASD